MRIKETHELLTSLVEVLKTEKEFKNFNYLEIYQLAINIYKVNLIDKIDDRLNDIGKTLEIINITKD